MPTIERPYTTRAKRALELADRAAADRNFPAIGTEHLLFGLVADPVCPAAQLLAQLGVTAKDVHRAWDQLQHRSPD